MGKKMRADQLLLEYNLAESRSQAQRLIMAGQVRADGQIVPKPSSKYSRGTRLLVDHGPRFVSRGGEKLKAAFEAFAIEAAGKICADVGASTGGFTDCLLQQGALKVYVIDVGKGLLHWKLRNDSRVVIMESTNARYLDALPEPVSLVTVDVSFISLKLILPVVKEWFSTDESTDEKSGDLVALIKPQFEAGRKAVTRGKGVIRDPGVHRGVLMDVLSFALGQDFCLRGLARSPVIGTKGNVEFLSWFQTPGESLPASVSLEALVSSVLGTE